MGEKLITAARVLMGLIYLINGLNWWFKIIAPYPSMSDFVHYLPPHDIVGAMIEGGILFHVVKATELVAGIALLTNRFVPLMLVAAFPVTVPVFIVDVFGSGHLRAVVVGSTSLLLNLFLLAAYMRHYQQIFAVKGEPQLDPAKVLEEGAPAPARWTATLARPAMPLLGILATVLGVATVIWLLVMIGQYVIDPQPLSAVHRLTPR